MAVSATVRTSTSTGRLTVEKEVAIAISANAGSESVTLDRTFHNTPTMLVAPPLGSAGTYTPAYVSGTPAITITVASETALTGNTVRVVLVAVDRDDA